MSDRRNIRRRRNKDFSCRVDPVDIEIGNIDIEQLGKDCDGIDIISSSKTFQSSEENKGDISRDLDAVDSVISILDELVKDSNSTTMDSFMVNKDDDSLLLTQRIHLKYTPELSRLCHLSKNLYNHGNFNVRKRFFYESFQGTNQLFAKMGSELIRLVHDSIHYKSLSAQTSQQTLRYLRKAWKGYEESLKSYEIDRSKFLGKPSIPGYLPPNGEYTTVIPGGRNLCTKRARQHFESSKRRNYNGTKTAEILFPKKIGIAPVRFRLDINGLELNLDSIHEVRIVPRGNHYICEVVYEKKKEKRSYPENNRVLGIDLGTNVLLAIVNNFGKHPILIKGGRIKLANYNVHKQNSKLHAEMFRMLDERFLSFKEEFLENKYVLRASVRILNYQLEHHLRKIKNGKQIIRFINSVLSLGDSSVDSSMDCFTLTSFSKIKNYAGYVDGSNRIQYNINKSTKALYEEDVKKVSEGVSERINAYLEEILSIVNQYHIKIQSTWNLRNRRVQDQLHKASYNVVDYAIENRVPIIVIGYNKVWKHKCVLGRRNNQNFQSIPFLKLIKMIEYKCALAGISVIRVIESFTSKCSALDFEPINHHNNFAGIRGPSIKGYEKKLYNPRGLFHSKKGLFIHSDVNAAFNIMRLGVEGCLDGYGISNMLLSPISSCLA